MRANNQFREKMLNHPTYWVEGINGMLYDAIVTYMSKHDMKRKDLAKHLNISAGRVSQILNDGDINFSLETIVEIAIKVGKFPSFTLEDKESFMEKEEKLAEIKRVFLKYDMNEFTKNAFAPCQFPETKVVKFVPKDATYEVYKNFNVSNYFVYSL